MSDGPFCAHQIVRLVPHIYDDGSRTDHWRCECGQVFVLMQQVAADAPRTTCPTCHGAGGWDEPTGHPSAEGGEDYRYIACSRCDGVGGWQATVDDDTEPYAPIECPDCGGAGRVRGGA